MKMLPFTVFTVLSTAAVVSGDHHVTCTTEPIQAEEGDDVTLRFCLDPPVNLSDHNLDVSRADLNNVVVHAYRDGKDLSEPQTSSYRDRTTLVHEDLQRGNITLKISSVQLSDSGQYRLFIPDLNVYRDLYLHVAEKGHRTTTEAPRTTTEAPRSSETPDADPQRKHDAAIVGGCVVGAVLLLGLIGLVVVGVLVKRGKIKLSSVSAEACSCWGVLCRHGFQQRYTPGRNTNHSQELQSEVKLRRQDDKHIRAVHNNNNNNNSLDLPHPEAVTAPL